MQIKRIEELTAEDIANLRFGELTPEELKEAYALAQASITAADLQRYTDLDEGIPVDDVLKEMEETQREIDSRSSK